MRTHQYTERTIKPKSRTTPTVIYDLKRCCLIKYRLSCNTHRKFEDYATHFGIFSTLFIYNCNKVSFNNKYIVNKDRLIYLVKNNSSIFLPLILYHTKFFIRRKGKKYHFVYLGGTKAFLSKTMILNKSAHMGLSIDICNGIYSNILFSIDITRRSI